MTWRHMCHTRTPFPDLTTYSSGKHPRGSQDAFDPAAHSYVERCRAYRTQLLAK